MDVRIVGPVLEIETIAEGHGIRELTDLRERYGRGSWRKKKELPRSSSQTVPLPKQRSTGTKPTASARSK